MKLPTLKSKAPKSVTTITAGLQKMANELFLHADAERTAANAKEVKASALVAAAGGHLAESNRAVKVAEKIESLLSA